MEAFSTETIAILGTVLTGGIFLSRQKSALAKELRGDILGLRTDRRGLGGSIAELRADMHGMESRLTDRIGAVESRLSHTDGLLEGLREAITGRNAA